MLALRARSALLNRSLKNVRCYSSADATYHRDPKTGNAYNDQGMFVMINDADIEKHWPSVHTKIHMHKQQEMDHVNMMHSGHYNNSATAFAWLTLAWVTVAGLLTVKKIHEGGLD